MGRLICSMMDFELDDFGDILLGERYREHDPEEYYWAAEDEENNLGHLMEVGFVLVQD